MICEAAFVKTKVPHLNSSMKTPVFGASNVEGAGQGAVPTKIRSFYVEDTPQGAPSTTKAGGGVTSSAQGGRLLHESLGGGQGPRHRGRAFFGEVWASNVEDGATAVAFVDEGARLFVGLHRRRHAKKSCLI